MTSRGQSCINLPTGKPQPEGPVRYSVMVIQSTPGDLGIVSVNVLDGASAKVLQDDIRTERKERLSQIPMSSLQMGECLGVCEIVDKKE